MKRIIVLLLAAATLLCAAPSVISGESGPAFVADPCAPATVSGDLLIIDETVTVAETLSYFRNGAFLAATDAEGNLLERSDKAVSGTKIVSGEESLTLVVRGDVTADGRISARDVVAAMNAVVTADDSAVAADVTADGAVNGSDVISLMRYLVGYDEYFGEAGALAKTGDAAVSVYFDSLMHRVSQRDASVHGSPAGVYYMAKSETEDAQLYIASKKQIAEVTVEVGALANADGAVLDVTMLDEHYYDLSVYDNILSGARFSSPTTGGPHGEALPRLRAPLDLQANESHAVVAQVVTKPTDASGWYAAPVTLKAADGTVIKEAKLRFYVWNFALDEKPATATAVGFSFDSVYKQAAKEEGKKTGEDYINIMNDKSFYNANMPRIQEDYMQLFLDSRISPYHLPYSVTDPQADEIMSNPRLTSFCVGGGGNYHKAIENALAEGTWIASDSEYISTFRKLAQNPDWLDKAYIYYVDEPSPYKVHYAQLVKEHIDGVLNTTDDLKGLKWHQLVPQGGNDPFTDPNTGVSCDTADYLYKYVDTMIPQSYAFTKWYSNSERKEYRKLYGYDPMSVPGVMTFISSEIWNLYPEQWQTRYDRYADEGGLRRWWYICCSPELPYPNYFTYYQGQCQRVTFWQQYMFHVEGFLYWATQDQWDATNLKRFPTNGDGVLLYWGELFGQTEPVTSIRWEYIRDGIEDFQYFSQLERVGVSRDDIVSNYINRVTTSILEFEDSDPYIYEATRIEIGFELESRSQFAVN